MVRTFMLVCGLLLCLILARYGSTPDLSPADLTLVEPGQINTLDPQQMTWSSDIRIGQNLWEGLARYDPDTLQPVGAAAQFPPRISPDGRVYTFQLRTDARWSNGDPVSAQDFMRGWRRAIEPGTAADYARLIVDHIEGAKTYYDWRNHAVELLAQSKDAGDVQNHRRLLARHSAEMDDRWSEVGISALDDAALQVTLVRPTPYFLELTPLAVMMPIHESIELLREGDPNLGIDQDGLVIYDSQWTKPDYHRNGYPGLITNGPYRVTEWQFRRRLRLSINPYYADHASLALATVDFMAFESTNTAFQAYETGVVDWLTDLNVDYVGELLAKRRTGQRPDIHISPAFGTYFYNLNCLDEHLPDGRLNPFLDVRVRQAFSISLDREKLCGRVAEKENPPAYTLIPPGSIPGYPAVPGHAPDPALAKRLLDEAGFRDRSLFPEVSILYNTGYAHERLAEAIANSWRQILGVRVRLEGQETKTFGENKAKHNFQIARAAWYGDYSDPTTFLDIFSTGNGNNDSGYSNVRFDALLAEAARCNDPSQRMQILARAETLLVLQDFPLIPIYQYTAPQAFRSYVKGIRPNHREIYPLRYVRVER